MSSLILSYFGYVSFNMDMFVDIDDTPQQPRSFDQFVTTLEMIFALHRYFSREVRKLDGGSSNLV